MGEELRVEAVVAVLAVGDAVLSDVTPHDPQVFGQLFLIVSMWH